VKIAIRVLIIAAIAAGLAFFIRGLDWTKLGHNLAKASPPYLALALLCVAGFVLGKAVMWRVLLLPKHKVPVVRLYRYTVAAFGGSAIAPARAGELLRIWALAERDNVPSADGAAVAIAGKLCEALSVAIVAAPLPFLVDLPAWVATGILGVAAIGIIAAISLAYAAGKIRLREDSRWFARFIASFTILRHRKQFALAVLVSVLTWCVDVGTIAAVMAAMGIDAPLSTDVLIFFTLNVTVAIPSTPAQAGAMELGVLAATRVVGIADEPALAFALVYHMMQVLPVVAGALILEFPLLFRRRAPSA
jgi:uncharacterized membrane protein YbhN (UPF0104 family)